MRQLLGRAFRAEDEAQLYKTEERIEAPPPDTGAGRPHLADLGRQLPYDEAGAFCPCHELYVEKRTAELGAGHHR